MWCANCGNELPDGARFCDNCGMPVQSVSAGCAPGGRTPGSAADEMADGNVYGGQQRGSAAPVPAQGGRGWKDWYTLVIIAALCMAAAAAGFIIKSRKQPKEEELLAAETREVRETDTAAETETPAEELTESETESETETETESETMTETEGVYDPAEGGTHAYRYFVDDCTWNEAFEKARESGGYLARINTPEEYAHILSEIEKQGYENIQFRIGGRRDADSSGYYWVDDDDNLYGECINDADYWAYAEWMQGEPSYTDGQNEEEYIDICYYSSEKRWVWNDVPDDIIAVVPSYSGKIGYIVEYENEQ